MLSNSNSGSRICSIVLSNIVLFNKRLLEFDNKLFEFSSFTALQNNTHKHTFVYLWNHIHTIDASGSTLIVLCISDTYPDGYIYTAANTTSSILWRKWFLPTNCTTARHWGQRTLECFSWDLLSHSEKHPLLEWRASNLVRRIFPRKTETN